MENDLAADIDGQSIEQIMDCFDTEARSMQADLRPAARAEFDKHMARAARLLSRRLREPSADAGWRARALRFAEQCSGETPERLAMLVEETWWDAADSGACQGRVREVARRRLEVLGPAFENSGGLIPVARALPALTLEARGTVIELVRPAVRISPAETGGLAEKFADARSSHERIRSCLGLMLGNETLERGEIDLIASVADLGGVILEAGGPKEIADSAAALAMPALLAAAGIGAVAAAAFDEGNKALVKRERLAFTYLAEYRKEIETDFHGKIADLLSHARGVVRARLSAGPRTDLRDIRDGIIKVLKNAKLLPNGVPTSGDARGPCARGNSQSLSCYP